MHIMRDHPHHYYKILGGNCGDIKILNELIKRGVNYLENKFVV